MSTWALAFLGWLQQFIGRRPLGSEAQKGWIRISPSGDGLLGWRFYFLDPFCGRWLCWLLMVVDGSWWFLMLVSGCWVPDFDPYPMGIARVVPSFQLFPSCSKDTLLAWKLRYAVRSLGNLRQFDSSGEFHTDHPASVWMQLDDLPQFFGWLPFGNLI